MATSAPLVNQYLDWAANVRRRSPMTVYKYRMVYVTLLDWSGSRSLESLTVDDLQRWLRRPRRQGKPAAPATIKTETMAVRSLFKWLYGRGIVSHDPTVQLLEECPEVHNDTPKPILDEDWLRVWRSDVADDMRVALGLGFICGLRRAEIVSLSAGQFASVPAQRIVAIRRKGGRHQDFPWRTAVELYAVRLPHLLGPDGPQSFLRPLERLLGERATQPALLPWGSNARGMRRTHALPDGAVNPDAFNRRLRPVLRNAGLPPDAWTPHNLRHSFCTNLIAAGVPIEVVSELAGHSSLDMTRRYIKLAADPLLAYVTAPDVAPSEAVAHYGRWGR